MSKLQIDFRRIPRGDEPIHVTPLTVCKHGLLHEHVPRF